jgi:Concanavalin A-like lectin/glucanases superfamily
MLRGSEFLNRVSDKILVATSLTQPPGGADTPRSRRPITQHTSTTYAKEINVFGGGLSVTNDPGFFVKNLTIPSSFSIGVRFKTSSTRDYATLFRSDRSIGTVIYIDINDGGPNYLVFLCGSGYINYTGTYRDNAWHSIVGVVERNSMTMYFDGVGFASASTNYSKTQYPSSYIGNDSYATYSTTYAFDGSYCDFFICRGALKQPEITLYHKNTRAQKTPHTLVGLASAPSTKPWLYRRSETVSRSYLQVS